MTTSGPFTAFAASDDPTLHVLLSKVTVPTPSRLCVAAAVEVTHGLGCARCSLRDPVAGGRG